MSLGQKFIRLGWQFDLRNLRVTIPDKKKKKPQILPLLDQVCDPKAKLERRTVERVIGMLLWFTGGCGWLKPKPWLEPLYKILFKPRAIPRLVNFTQFLEIVQALDANLVVTEHARCCDVCLKWRLHSINKCQGSSHKSGSFVTPKSHNGQISLIFFD